MKPPRRDGWEAKGKMLTPEEARALLDAIRGDRLEAVYLALLTAGLPRGEALGLRWIDVAIDAPTGATLHIRQQLQLVRGLSTLVPLKSRKVSGRSRCHPSHSSLTRAPRIAGLERQGRGENNWRAHGLVFNADNGGPLHRSTMTTKFHTRTKAAGLGHLCPHDLRHTYGSLLMSQRVPLKTISELMAHASIEVTADIYVHSLDVQVRDTARSVERALASPGGQADGACRAFGRALPSTAALPADSGRVAARVAP